MDYITVASPDSTNFGDELNHYIWPKIFADLLNRDDGYVLLGIGTLLGEKIERLETEKTKIVFSAGAGYISRLPHFTGTTKFVCVRGPLTASFLGLPERFAVTDGAAFLHSLYDYAKAEKPTDVGFMPHHTTHKACGAAWQAICDNLGITYLNPLEKPEDLLGPIASCKTLLAEALHGAIAADAFRIPWIPVVSSPGIQQFKWWDWAMSLDLEYRPFMVPSLHGVELAKRTQGQKIVSGFMKKAERRLADARLAKPFLSEDAILAKRLERLSEGADKVRAFVRQ